MLPVKQLVWVTVIALVMTACCHSGDNPTVEESTPASPATITRHSTLTTTKTQRSNAEVENALQAIVLDDPRLDAANAIKSGTAYLWAYNSRSGKIIPGTENQSEHLLKDLKTRTAPGMGDVIYSDKHQKLRKQFIEYATIYNQSILHALEK